MRYIDFRIPPAETFTGIRARRGKHLERKRKRCAANPPTLVVPARAREFGVWVVPLTAAVEDRVARARNVIP